MAYHPRVGACARVQAVVAVDIGHANGREVIIIVPARGIRPKRAPDGRAEAVAARQVAAKAAGAARAQVGLAIAVHIFKADGQPVRQLIPAARVAPARPDDFAREVLPVRDPTAHPIFGARADVGLAVASDITVANRSVIFGLRKTLGVGEGAERAASPGESAARAGVAKNARSGAGAQVIFSISVDIGEREARVMARRAAPAGVVGEGGAGKGRGEGFSLGQIAANARGKTRAYIGLAVRVEVAVANR